MINKMVGPYTVLDTKEIYKNPWLTLREDKVIRPGGSEGIFGIIEMVPGSSVLPLDNDGNVYLVSEYKYGIEKDSLETISGALNENELPIDAAKRELKEELGLVASKWRELGYVDPFTTTVQSQNHLFLAEGITQGDSNPDEGEELKLVKVKFDEAVKMVLNGKITHSASCVLILKAAKVLGR